VRPGRGGANPNLDATIARFRIGRHLRQQRHPITVRHHLHHRRKARRAQADDAVLPGVSAIRDGLVAQTVALLQQDQPLRIDVIRVDAGGAGARLVSRNRQQKRVFEETDGFDIGLGDGQRKDEQVERAARQLLKQYPGLRLAHFDAQVGEPLLQGRQDFREQIGRDGRDDTEHQPPGQQAAAVAGEIDKVALRREDALAALRHFGADVREHNIAGTAFDEIDFEHPFQLANLHRQGRLRHRARFGGASEMPMLRQGAEVPQLSEGRHVH